MPLTRDFLQDELGAIEYFGYNKVGDNTFPNLIPVLSGMNRTELGNTCWPNKSYRFDNCTFLWSKYHEAGYVTAFAEDAAWMGLFNYFKKGFIKQPVTHMWGAFDREAEHAIGYQGKNSKLCTGVKLTFQYLNEYTLKFLRTYRKVKQNYFGLFWENTITHDVINYDPKADKLYRDFFKDIVLTGALENTILFLMSDHGIRWGGIERTFQGHMEERLPLLFVVPPRWFKEKYPDIERNMKDNSRKLTSNFDIYETLKAIVNEDYSSEPIDPIRGVSLFRPVPLNRTCESAGIPPYWCTCHESAPLRPDDTLAISAVDFVANHINHLLLNHTYCAKVTFDKIIHASVSKSVNLDKKYQTTYVTVVFSTLFVGAVFEATIRCKKCDTFSDFELGGPISRNNLYGHQGDCIKDAKLRLYCYCKM